MGVCRWSLVNTTAAVVFVCDLCIVYLSGRKGVNIVCTLVCQ